MNIYGLLLVIALYSASVYSLGYQHGKHRFWCARARARGRMAGAFRRAIRELRGQPVVVMAVTPDRGEVHKRIYPASRVH